MSTEPLTILWVDAKTEYTTHLATVLEAETKAGVFVEPKPIQALARAQKQEIDLCLINIQYTEQSMPDFIPRLKEIDPSVVIAVAVPENQRQELIQALTAGAHFHICLPYDHEEVVLVSTRGLKHRELVHLAGRSRPSLRQSDGFHGIIGISASMRRLFDFIERIAVHDQEAVLIQGEPGTGKELVAKTIHDLSPRAGQRFLAINCGTALDEQLEGELFGPVKGTSSGTDHHRTGRIAIPDQGTLFLDEIESLQHPLQSKILQLLQAKEVEPLEDSAKVRVIAATDINLEKAVQEGRFRQDLYHRLSMAPLNIPPLRDRPEDIPALVQTFVMMYNRGVKFGVQRFSTQAMHSLQSYSWPGNVRELENLVQRMCILHCNQTVHVQDLPPKYRGARRSDRPVTSASSIHDPANLDFYTRMSQLEDQLILNALQQAKGNKKQAAQILNMKRTTLLEKIKKKKLGPALEAMMKKNAPSAHDCPQVSSSRNNSTPVSS
ncbi:MAG: sigma-54-dependent transcriptional regulator [Thermodesulfobacteriota bacterium]